jgi:polyhydroxyalkanoate synthesis regulator phasin
MAVRGSDRVLEALEELLGELPARARGLGARLGEGGQDALRTLARELGLVTREEYDELELRVAQLEHRLRLLENEPRALPGP